MGNFHADNLAVWLAVCTVPDLFADVCVVGFGYIAFVPFCGKMANPVVGDDDVSIIGKTLDFNIVAFYYISVFIVTDVGINSVLIAFVIINLSFS